MRHNDAGIQRTKIQSSYWMIVIAALRLDDGGSFELLVGAVALMHWH